VKPGDLIELEIGKVANGGTCIARHDGRVVFVRLALPGEKVIARVTGVNSKYLRADVETVLDAHQDRVPAPCSVAQVCGGCDWQHATHNLQLKLKAEVIREQLSHATTLPDTPGTMLGDLVVEPLGESPLRWRTRNRFHRIDDEHLGLYAARSKSVVEIEDCLIAVPGSVEVAREALPFVRGDVSTVSSAGETVVVDPRGGPMISERVRERTWRIHASSFWQVHRHAPEAFTEIVLSMAAVSEGDKVADLYSGAGLFTAPLAQSVGHSGTVLAVESGIDAVRDARRSLSDLGNVDLITADALSWLQTTGDEFDVVVVDPPRTGVGAEGARHLARIATRAIVYVACEPSALARDAAILLDEGWHLAQVRAVDAFPMTSHVETFALFNRR
jgi:tRNA/tmRNA/rRNA uracil-C5-methylase (TrmA/RlmC/RlmD family)